MCPQSPTGRPYPSAAQAGPEGLGCNRRCVGEGPHRVPAILHGASLSPLSAPGRDRETPTRSPCGRRGDLPVPWLAGGGVVLTPSYPLAAASPYFNFIQRIPTGRPKWDSRHGGHGGASPYFIFLSK